MPGTGLEPVEMTFIPEAHRALSGRDFRRTSNRIYIALKKSEYRAACAKLPARKIKKQSQERLRMHYAIDKVYAFRSYVFCEGWFSGLPNGDVAVLIGNREFHPDIEPMHRPDLPGLFGAGSEGWGFTLACKIDSRIPGWQGLIALQLTDSEKTVRVDRPAEIQNDAQRRGASDAELEFFRLMHDADNPAVLEIGSRMRSGNAKTSRLPVCARYVGFDIGAGENVDVIGDAHFMSQHLPHDHFDFVFSISTFEHLLMPWKVAIELNKVMKMGGLAFIHSHQSWPVHDAPWDFYRFSKFGWHGLFNHFTGFEIIASEHAEPAAMIPQTQMNNPATFLDGQTGYLMSVCMIRKIGPCAMTWDADPTSIISTAYPA
jgi:hypothetical protein